MTVQTSLRVVITSIVALALGACTQLGLRYASLKTDNKDAVPPIALADAADWKAEADRVREAFAKTIYGPWPAGLPIAFGETRIADKDYLDGRGILEETPIILGEGESARTFHLAVAYPKAAIGKGPMPVIVGQSFSTNCYILQSRALTAPNGEPCEQTNFGGFGGWLIKNILGRYIAKAPVEQYFDLGIAYANFYASEIVPDANAPAQRVMAAFRAHNDVEATSALSYWAYGFSAARDFLDQDERVDTQRLAVWGHSRHGKAALVAGAWDERLPVIAAHQSGFGGASLSRSKAGERLDRVVKNYPHWFDPAIADYAKRPEDLPLDQHQLIALIAPRPVLLGNGRRDVWSDPNSAYVAAQAADPIYEAYGVAGLDQDGMRRFNPAAEIAFHMRPGAHGVTPEDVDAFIAFFEAHLVSSETSCCMPGGSNADLPVR